MTGKRFDFIRVIGLVGISAAAFGGIPGATASQASAQISAQVQPTEPTHAIVTDKRAMVRCGPGAAYYPVAELRPNDILIVDGDTPSGWARVQFPDNASALVRADYVDLSPDGKTVTLNRDDGLIAYNALAGARGSWSKLLPEPLKAGTKLEVIAQASNDLTNELIGYQVKAPEKAHGFVRMSFIRPATTSEVEAWIAANTPDDTMEADADEGAPIDPAIASNDQTPPNDPAQEMPAQEMGDQAAAGTEQAQPVEDQTMAEADPEPLVQPMISDETPAVATPEPETETAVGPEESEHDESADLTQAEPEEAEKPAPLRISSIEELEQLFTAVQKQTPEEAEFGPLLAEVQRMYDATPDTPENAGLRRALRKRLSVLKIRQRLQETARSNAKAVESASIREQEVANRIREIEIERSYAVVGRLLPSAVYDGKRLPRMYRVQSLGTTEAPRTLGYLKPDPKLNLELLLGKTIGVVGKPQLDPRLNLLIIKPIKVDVIKAGNDAGQQ
ncbi:MAG TPA: hypothetical protein ENJ00_08760 [Phycisphaerales bacterium]|nr:hypothetical protein [Phycisphaerales bacterium]